MVIKFYGDVWLKTVHDILTMEERVLIEEAVRHPILSITPDRMDLVTPIYLSKSLRLEQINLQNKVDFLEKVCKKLEKEGK